jgi:serine/threonine-protein kinase ATR
MAPESQGPYNGTASSYARNGQSQAGPPPSTLAAELVENISATAKLSRTDETAELKRLSAVIEKVKNQPGLLTTTEDRVEHNNMLIYVYTRVVLESLRWDDSSADPLHLRAEALKALEFLRVTIKETPEVLMYRTNGSSLLFRGTEPLWAWLLPRILKPLAQEQCGSIFTELEGFCEFLLRTALHKSSLHDVVRSLLCYFQANIDGKHDQPRCISQERDNDHRTDVLLHVEKPVASAAAVQPALTLPPKSVLKGFSEHAFAFGLTRDPSENSTFRLVEKSEALRYAFAGLKVVVRTLLDEKDAEVSAELLTRNATWLLDYCLRLRLLLPRGGNILQLRPIDLLPLTLKLVNAMGEATGVAAALRAKGSVATVLIIASAAKSMAEVTSEITAESKAALSTAVLEVAKLCSQSDNISQLARSELLAHLMKLASQCGANVASADLVVCTLSCCQCCGRTLLIYNRDQCSFWSMSHSRRILRSCRLIWYLHGSMTEGWDVK